jgi:hypothetical protein
MISLRSVVEERSKIVGHRKTLGALGIVEISDDAFPELVDEPEPRLGVELQQLLVFAMT